MTSKIEDVARALAKRRYGDDGYRGSEFGGEYWELCVDDARVAIEAMREPNAAMQAVFDDHAGTIAPEYAWRDAIDAALKDPAQ